jgi:3-oxoacyl-[acyl-carrier protein] reductase
MAKLLDDKAAIVTGASQGLGLAIATALAVDGAKVLMVARDERNLAEAAAGVREIGGTAAIAAADITKGGAPQEIVERALAEFGRVDILVNNAGVFVWKQLFDLDSADWDRTIATNLSAPFHLLRAASKVMVEKGAGGSIVNIASIHGVVGDANVVPHCAAKFGLVGLTRAAADALREHGVRVNAIAPGSIAPGSADRWGAGPAQKVTQADIASLVVYLSSHFSRTVTGAVIEMYGSTHTVIKV